MDLPLAAAFTVALFASGVAIASAATTTCSTVAACVLGANTGTGFGVEGTSKLGSGVVGVTTKNATSSSASEDGVEGVDKSTNTKGFNIGVFGVSTYGTGVRGNSQSGLGVVGTSHTNVGVAGKSGNSSGVSGQSLSSYGVSGTSKSSFGVYGSADSGTGVGVYGSSDYDTNGVSGVGVLGYTYDGVGVKAIAESSEFTSPNAIEAVAGDEGVRIFEGRLHNDAVVSIDASGNMILGGNLQQNGSPLFRTSGTNGSSVTTFGDRVSQPTLEDLGEAQLINGKAEVTLDPRFAASVDGRGRYLVFLTPMGDTRGLFVSERSAKGFTVREVGGGRASLAFDYRIAAKPYDTVAARLPSTRVLPQLRRNVVDRIPLAAHGRRARTPQPNLAE